MFLGQGRAASPKEIDRILRLLEETDLAISDIAESMSCSRSLVATVNRKFQVRDYQGNRTRWTLTRGSRIDCLEL